MLSAERREGEPTRNPPTHPLGGTVAGAAPYAALAALRVIASTNSGHRGSGRSCPMPG